MLVFQALLLFFWLFREQFLEDKKRMNDLQYEELHHKEYMDLMGHQTWEDARQEIYWSYRHRNDVNRLEE
jgi:hypothetical protein